MAHETLPQIVALRLKDKDPKLLLVDIRPAGERAIAHIPGDVHVPAEQFLKDAAKYQDKDVVLYCRTGTRSGILADALAAKGFTNVTNMAGGIHAWADKVDPSVPKYEHKH